MHRALPSLALFLAVLSAASASEVPAALQASAPDGTVRVEWKPEPGAWVRLGDNQGLAVLRPAPVGPDKKALPLNIAPGELVLSHPGPKREEVEIYVSGSGGVGLQVNSGIFLATDAGRESRPSVLVTKRALIPKKNDTLSVTLMEPKGWFERGRLEWSFFTSFGKKPLIMAMPYIVLPAEESTQRVAMPAIRPKPFSFTRRGAGGERVTYSPSAVAGPWMGFGGVKMAQVEDKDSPPGRPSGFWVFASGSTAEMPVMTQVTGLPAGAMLRVVLRTRIGVRAELADAQGRRMELVPLKGEELDAWTERWFVVPPDPLFPEARTRAIWLWLDQLAPQGETGLIEIRTPRT